MGKVYSKKNTVATDGAKLAKRLLTDYWQTIDKVAKILGWFYYIWFSIFRL